MRLACLLLALAAPGLALAAEGMSERVGGRGELFDRLSRTAGADGSRPEVRFTTLEDERALRFELESGRTADGRRLATVTSSPGSSAPCTVILARDPDLVWTLAVTGICTTQTPPPPSPTDPVPVPFTDRFIPKKPWFEAGLGPVVGNRGGGGTLRLGGGLAWQRGVVGLEVGARAWGAAELAPDQRIAGGVDAVFRAGEGGFVELGAGLAGLWERARLCADCERDTTSGFGPSLSGAVGIRGALTEKLEVLGALGGRSLPDRRFQLGLTVAFVAGGR